MYKVPHMASERFYQLPGTVRRKTDHINDHIRCQFANLLPKAAYLLGSGSVNRYLPH
jgi:hypothetical protein